MRRHTISNREAFDRVRPRNGNDKYALSAFAVLMFIIGVLIAGFFYTKHRNEIDREQNWTSATAIIEDARIQLVSRGNSYGGGAMLYEVQILAKYPFDGATREQWITVNQQPMLLADAQLKVFRWKGKSCFVRWKPSDPDRIVAEVS